MRKKANPQLPSLPSAILRDGAVANAASVLGREGSYVTVFLFASIRPIGEIWVDKQGREYEVTGALPIEIARPVRRDGKIVSARMFGQPIKLISPPLNEDDLAFILGIMSG